MKATYNQIPLARANFYLNLIKQSESHSNDFEAINQH